MTNNNAPDQLRSLWQGQAGESTPMSVEELHRLSKRFMRRIFWRNLREYLAAAFVVYVMGRNIVQIPHLFPRLGSALIIVATSFVVYYIHRRGSAKAIGARTEASSCVEFYRAELVRQRDLLFDVWKWYILPFVPGITIYFFGVLYLVLSQPGAHFHYRDILWRFGVSFTVMLTIVIFIHKLNRWGAQKLQKKIDRLDELNG